MSSTVFVRLKEEYGKYLVLTSPTFSLIIEEGGENSPAGFELERESFERYEKYLEVVPRKDRAKKREKDITLEE